MSKVGRRPIEIDWQKFESLCAMQCTLVEIAEYFKCSEDTIERKVKERYAGGFADTFKRKRVTGLISLRHNMFELSKKNADMAKFLAKNWLGMKDTLEHAGEGGGPIKHEVIIRGVADETKRQLQEVIKGEGT